MGGKSMFDPRAWALCCVLCAAPASGAGGVSIFSLGQQIDLRPWPVFAMFILVIIVSVFYELLTHHIEHVVTSRSGRAIVAHIYKEVMILGGISLLLTILENSGGDLLFEPVFYHYVHFVIFFMAINLILAISCLFLRINRSWHQWSFFESVVTGIERDPRLALDERHAILNQYVRRCPDGRKMLACMLFFRSNLPLAFRKVSFTRYMKKQQRKELLSFLHLGASAWASLAILMLLVAIQAAVIADAVGPDAPDLGGSGNATGVGVAPEVVAQPLGCNCSDAAGSAGSGSGSGETYGERFDLTVMLVFIGVEGYGTMFLILVCFLKVSFSYTRFADNVEAMRKENKLKPIVPQHYYFWRGKPKLMMSGLQVMLLCQVFYLATITCNLAPRLIEVKGGVFLLVLAVVPPACVFFFLIPRLMPKYTILTSVGDMLDMETLQHVQMADDQSGKYRRMAHRAMTASEPPPVLSEMVSPLDDYVDALIKQEQESTHKRGLNASADAFGGKKAAGGGGGGHDHGHGASHGTRQVPELICEECESQLAHVNCGVCGMLCAQCDADYHRLKKNQNHLLIAIKGAKGHLAAHGTGALMTDQPLLRHNAKAASSAKPTSPTDPAAEQLIQ